MNFGGALSMDGLASVSSLFSSESEPLKESNSKQRGLFESGLSKHGRWDGVEENDWNRFNMAKGDSMLAATSSKEQSCFLRSSSSHSLFPHGEKMLSFTSTKPDAAAPLNADWALQFYRHASTSSSSSSAPLYLRNAGMGFGNSTVSMPGIVAGVRGPFTPSQWVELEHQALIYKYIIAKVPIPSSLLAPMRRSLYPSLFPVFSAGSYNRSASTLAWGSFHPGFSGSSDPEPGRCRRTDGKKWRCSRDAVADQKYCERHLNRVRHRSRKHVEGHNGHATKAAMPAIITCSQSASVASGGNLSKNLTVAQQQRTSLKPSMTDQSPVQLNRLPPNKENTSELARNSRGPSMLPNLSPKSTGVLLPILKQQNPFEGTSAHADFDLICTDSLVNPQGSSYSENISFAVSNSEINCQPSSSHHLRCFFDELPKNSSDRSTFIWPDADEMQSDRTQLSISIPMASLDNSSSSSPNQGKHSFSPHRLSSEFNTLNDDSQRYSNWVPISWEPTIGGPLGEVVTNKSTTPKDLSRNLISSSSLNLLTDGWNSSPIMESSPTGVLQKTSFGSLSSSAGSSPRAEIENDERNET